MLQLEIPYSDGSNNGNGANGGAGDLTNRGAYRGLFNGKIFIPSAPQEEIYYEFDHYVDGLVRGITGCIFAYGQTGTGKT